MPKRRATVVVAGLTLGCALTPAPAGATPRQDSVERSVVAKINAVRAQSGLRRLRRSYGLAVAADQKALEVAGTDALDHGSPDGTAMSQRVRRYVSARLIGETLGLVPTATAGEQAATVVGNWFASPGHRAALLSPQFRRVGISRRTAVVGSGPVSIFALDLASAR